MLDFCKRIALIILPKGTVFFRFARSIYENFFLRSRRWLKFHPGKKAVANMSNRGGLGTTEAYIYLHTFSKPPENYRRFIEFPACPDPEISIVIPVYNKFHYTTRCLETLRETASGLSCEVLIADDCSSDDTIHSEDYFKNIRYVRNSENMGFLRSCNNAIRQARGKYVYLLNNDTELLPETVRALYETLTSSPDIGLVGSRLIYPNKTLQEAGSIIWNDATCLGYGRGDDPFKGEYSFLRDVDFCSGASIMFSRELFLSLGGFDERFAPAYYEEADFCMRLAHNGYRVVYQPDSMLIHHEYASGCSENSMRLMMANQKKFFEKWQDDLKQHLPPGKENVLEARYHDRKPHILIIDDLVPDARIGAGFPRAEKILDKLLKINAHFTFLSLLDTKENILEFPVDVIYESKKKYRQAGVELICSTFRGKLISFTGFLKERKNYFSLAMISRSHNMEDYRKCGIPISCPIIYDAEAINGLRMVEWLKLQGKKLGKEDIEFILNSELSLTRNAGAVLSVSPREQHLMREGGARNVEVLSHEVELSPAGEPFEKRTGLLWVGGVLLEDPGMPNFDSLLYFITEIMPHLPKEITFSVVGEIHSPKLLKLKSSRVRFLGGVNDIRSIYAKAKMFVVPTRFAAGVPLKLYEASAHGLPSVVSPLILNQVGWTADEDVLAGATPAEFAAQIMRLYNSKTLWTMLRDNSMKRVAQICSSELFDSVLYNTFSSFLGGAREENSVFDILLPRMIGDIPCLELGSLSLLGKYPELKKVVSTADVNAEAAAEKLSKINSKYPFVVLSHGLERALDPVSVLQSALDRLLDYGFLMIIGSDVSSDSPLHTPFSEDDLKKRHAGSVTPEDILARRYQPRKRSDTPLWQKRIADQVQRDIETCAVFNHWSCCEAVSMLKAGLSLLNRPARIVCEIPGDLFDGDYVIFVSLDENVKMAKHKLLWSFWKALYAVRPDLQLVFPEVAARHDRTRFFAWMKDCGLSVDGFKSYISLFEDVINELPSDAPCRQSSIFDPVFTRIIGDDKCLDIGFDTLGDLLPLASSGVDVIDAASLDAPSKLARISSKYPFVILDRYLEGTKDPVGALQSALALVEKGGFLAVCGLDASSSGSSTAGPVTEQKLLKLHGEKAAARELLRNCPFCGQGGVPGGGTGSPSVFHWSFQEMETSLKNSIRLLGLPVSIVYSLSGERFGGFYIFLISQNPDDSKAVHVFLKRFCKALYGARSDLQSAFPEFGTQGDSRNYSIWLKSSGLTVDAYSPYLKCLEAVLMAKGL